MKIVVILSYFHPLKQMYCSLPPGLSIQVYDLDIGFHDQIGQALTDGGVVEIDAQGWGECDKPDVYFEIATQGREIDLLTGCLVQPGELPTGPVLQLPEGRWDSRSYGPACLFSDVNPDFGLGSRETPLELRLEAALGFYRPIFWNHLGKSAHNKSDSNSDSGAHETLPHGTSFHVRDDRGEVVGRGAVLPDGLLYIPIFKKVGAVTLHLDADYNQPLIIDLDRRTIVKREERNSIGNFLTITSWQQGKPCLTAEGSLPRYLQVGIGKPGSLASPIQVDISSSPWTFGNHVQYLIDGDETYRHMLEAFRSAGRSIHLSGWDFSPDVWLDRLSGSRETVATVLMDLAQRNRALSVRLLIWANPLSFFALRSAQKRFDDFCQANHCHIQLVVGRCGDARSHHQKLLVIDGQVAFAGGIDLSFGRWATQDHIPEWNQQVADPDDIQSGDFKVPPWHDVHVRLEGPVVAALERNFAARWKAACDETLEVVPIATGFTTGLPVLPCRTWPKEVPGAESAEFDELNVRTLFLRAISRAHQSIYIEQQYLNSKPLAKALVGRIQWAMNNQQHNFRLAIVLPSYFDEPAGVGNHMAFLQEECLTLLRRADPSFRFLRLFCLKTWNESKKSYGQIYVHAKVMIIDDAWVTVGSANSNYRSLEYDTELNVAVEDRAGAKLLQQRLFREHARTEISTDTTRALDQLWELALQNQQALEMRDYGTHPLDRRIFPHRPENTPRRMLLPDESDLLF